MKLKCIKYPKIPAFDAAVLNVKRATTYVGRDEDNNPIWDNTQMMPTITFEGSVKIHGTNSSVRYDNIHGLRAQSREHIITSNKRPVDGVQGDNAGFCKHMEDNEKVYMGIIESYVSSHNIDLDKNTLVIYGEWAGKGIQSKVAITQLDKAFYCIGVRVKPIIECDFNDEADKEFRHPSTWIKEIGLVYNYDARIFNMKMFKSYEIKVDFSDAQKSEEYLESLVDEVEAECPVANEFGVKGIGEGVVFKAIYKGRMIMFKIKGEKHSGSKIRVPVKADPIKVKNIDDFVEKYITKERVMKGIENGIVGEEPTIKHTGNVLKWVMRDVITEELHTLEASGLTSKEVSPKMIHNTKKYFQEYLKELAFS